MVQQLAYSYFVQFVFSACPDENDDVKKQDSRDAAEHRCALEELRQGEDSAEVDGVCGNDDVTREWRQMRALTLRLEHGC